MTKVLEFPLWLEDPNTSDDPDTRSINKNCIRLANYLAKDANNLLKDQNITVKYLFKYYDVTEDPMREQLFNKQTSYASDRPNILAFYAHRIYSNQEKTFSAHKLNKIKFADSDPTWNIKRMPEKTYDLNTATNFNNPELVGWYSNTNKF